MTLAKFGQPRLLNSDSDALNIQQGCHTSDVNNSQSFKAENVLMLFAG